MQIELPSTVVWWLTSTFVKTAIWLENPMNVASPKDKFRSDYKNGMRASTCFSRIRIQEKVQTEDQKTSQPYWF